MANFSAGSLRLNWEKEIEVERAPRRKWAGMSSRRSSFTVGTDWFGCGYREQQGVVLSPSLPVGGKLQRLLTVGSPSQRTLHLSLRSTLPQLEHTVCLSASPHPRLGLALTAGP